jgi:chaperonin GroEL
MKQITYDQEAMTKIKAGVDKLANAVKTTLGPGGSNVIIEENTRNAHITKDGVTVARSISLEDPIENLGAQIVKEAASRTATMAGDGTTTATVLAQAILTQGIKNVVAGANRIDIKRGIDMATKAIVAEIKKMAIPVGDNVRNIALISANGDDEVADLITEAIQKVTKDGLVIVEDSRNATSEVSVIEGMTFDRGWLNHYFINTPESGTCEFNDPLILLVDYIIEEFAPMIPILRKIQMEYPERPILIVAEDVRGNALSTLALNVNKTGLRICAVQSPDFGDTRKEVLKDLAALTMATIITKDAGMTLSNIDVTVCGTCEKIRVSQWETTIFGGAGRGGLLEARLELMKTQMEQTNENALAKLKDRFARLTGLIGVIHIGGFSEIEVREKKDRIDDALQATRAAIEEGIVPGGGVAYVRALQAVRAGSNPEAFNIENDDQFQGTEILFRSIMEPIKCVAENVGVSGEVVLNEVNRDQGIRVDISQIPKAAIDGIYTMGNMTLHSVFPQLRPSSYGFNAKTHEYEDLLAAGVIDPAKVTRLALENAASVSGMLLTTKSIITYLPQKP